MIALACGESPTGRWRRTIRPPAVKLVEPEIVKKAAIPVTVCPALTTTGASLGPGRRGDGLVKRDNDGAAVHRCFTTADVRIKLKRLYLVLRPAE